MRRLLLVAALHAPLAHAQIAPGEQPSPSHERPTREGKAAAPSPRERPLPVEPPPPRTPVASPPTTATPPKTAPPRDQTPAPVPGTTNAPIPTPADPRTPKPKDNIPTAPDSVVDEPPAPVPLPADDSMTTPAWRADPPLDIHWSLLSWPERMVELAFLPVGMVVAGMEEYRVDKRFKDWTTFYDGRIKIAPRFKFSLGDGAGAGLWVKRVGLFRDRAELRGGAIARLDGDYQIEGRYEHAYLLPGGRGLRVEAYIEDDKNQRYYGLGGDSREVDRRVVASHDRAFYVETDLQSIDAYTYGGTVSIGVREQQLSPGTDNRTPALEVGDVVTPPPGFNDRALYADLLVLGRRDTRDTPGRPMRGLLVEGAALVRKDLYGNDLSSVTFSGLARWHLPVIAEGRSFVLQAAGAAAMRLLPGDEIPLDSMAVLGRTNVRGYDRERFRDRYAVVATAEYRFPIYEYMTSKAGLDAFVFYDVGTLWGQTPFSLDPLRWSTGGGLRGAHETTSLFEVTLGYSPEGLQFNIGVEKAL